MSDPNYYHLDPKYWLFMEAGSKKIELRSADSRFVSNTWPGLEVVFWTRLSGNKRVCLRAIITHRLWHPTIIDAIIYHGAAKLLPDLALTDFRGDRDDATPRQILITSAARATLVLKALVVYASFGINVYRTIKCGVVVTRVETRGRWTEPIEH